MNGYYYQKISENVLDLEVREDSRIVLPSCSISNNYFKILITLSHTFIYVCSSKDNVFSALSNYADVILY